MKGMQEGFWPLDKGEWSFEPDIPLKNYSTSPEDFEAIYAFYDKELAAHHWSDPISELLPGIKISPIFVIWQYRKPPVITDHIGSGLNDGIPATEAHV